MKPAPPVTSNFTPGSPLVDEVVLGLRQRRMPPVLLRQNRLGGRPVDAERRIVPGDAPVVLGRVELVDLVLHFRVRLERAEAVGATLRHEQLQLVLRAQDETEPLAVGRRALADIEHDVEHGAGRHPHELRLRLRVQLIMEATQYYRFNLQEMVVIYNHMHDFMTAKHFLITS